MEHKGYKIEGDGTFGYKRIKVIGKGSVHMSLRGAYTTPTEAVNAIDRFLGEKEETTNASKKPTSRGK